MDDLCRHVLICDPQPADEVLEHWREAISETAAGVLRLNSPAGLFEACNDLATMVRDRAAPTGVLRNRVGSVAVRFQPEALPADAALSSRVCALLAVNRALRGRGPKREVLAVATWSALSFTAPSYERRLETLRTATLACARRVSLQMATDARERVAPDDQSSGSGGAADRNRKAPRRSESLRKSTAADREEIAVLRWLLADESTRLGLRYVDIPKPETAALAMALELGRLVTAFPTMTHYRLGERFVPAGSSVTLFELVKAVGHDREALALPYHDHALVTTCPYVFPLLAALATGSVEGTDAHMKRSLMEWWGRALLESAAVALGAKKGWS